MVQGLGSRIIVIILFIRIGLETIIKRFAVPCRGTPTSRGTRLQPGGGQIAKHVLDPAEGLLLPKAKLPETNLGYKGSKAQTRSHIPSHFSWKKGYEAIRFGLDLIP